MSDAKRVAEVHILKSGPTPVVELHVPQGTRLVDALKVQELLSHELLPKLTPRGCLPCISGAHFIIRERFDDVIRVDLEANRIIG